MPRVITKDLLDGAKSSASSLLARLRGSTKKSELTIKLEKVDKHILDMVRVPSASAAVSLSVAVSLSLSLCLCLCVPLPVSVSVSMSLSLAPSCLLILLPPLFCAHAIVAQGTFPLDTFKTLGLPQQVNSRHLQPNTLCIR
jgi:hypothetical protein